MKKIINLTKKFDMGLVLSVVLILFTLLPLLRPGFFTMHDNEQVGRLYDLDLAVKAWHIPPRMSENLGFGYGYPFFNFYPPFVYYIAELFSLVGFSYVISTKLMIFTGFILTSLFMYLFSRQYLTRAGALVSAVLYTYAPYHALDIYVRGALPEFFSFAFIPAIFWSLTLLQKTTNKKYLILSSFLITGLILTHNLVVIMSLPFFAVYFIFLLISAEDKKKFAILAILSGSLALGLSCYFWLPSYFERNLTLIEILTQDLASYSQHFVYLRQFWDSTWGYGGSMLGLGDGISFEIGKIHLILICLTLFVVPVFVKKQIKIYLIFVLMFLFSIFMATFHSKKIWDLIPQLSYVQFPWRFLLFTAFTSSFLGGFVASFKNKKFSLVAAGVVISITIYYMTPFFKPYKYLPSADDAYYTNKEYIRYETSRLAAEYVPKGVATKRTYYGTSIVDIEKDQIARSVYTLISGKGSISVLEDLPQRKTIVTDSKANMLIRLNTFSFPNWIVLLDNKKIKYSDNNRLKLITVKIPKGRHTVKALFTDTKVRIVSNTVSLITLIAVILYTTTGSYFLRRKINKHAKTF